MSDIVCTSANAVKVINSLPADKPIIFAPDVNLGHYLVKETGRELILWNGSCLVHENFSMDKILELHRQHPQAKFIAHPESQPHILQVATYIGSTKGMIDFVKKDPATEFIVATEAGILYTMKKEVPNKVLIAAPSYEVNTCACSECPYMKMTSLQKIHDALLYESHEVHVDEDIRLQAARSLNCMLMLQ